MVKFTKSNPNSKRKGVKKETMSYIAVFQCNIYTKPDGYAVFLGVINIQLLWSFTPQILIL